MLLDLLWFFSKSDTVLQSQQYIQLFDTTKNSYNLNVTDKLELAKELCNALLASPQVDFNTTEEYLHPTQVQSVATVLVK